MHETTLRTRLFEVRHRTCADRNGQPLVRDVVVHPGAVVILPLLDDGRIVMIHNFRHATEEELFELPAGTLRDGKSIAVLGAYFLKGGR